MQPNHYIITRSVFFQSPSKYSNRIMRTSLNIFTEASITFNFEPSTSFHSTGTSPIEILKILHKTNSYISKAHLYMWRILKSMPADYFVKSLNPHWVSFVFTPHTMLLMNPKTPEINYRWNFLYTFDYY